VNPCRAFAAVDIIALEAHRPLFFIQDGPRDGKAAAPASHLGMQKLRWTASEEIPTRYL